ncbi:DUF7133 domain-containing protein [Fimbriiglobus ruber]|uniref:Cytochrome c domain-containing protein n=1 Tax=Fimbriiglobus ruber TaxID=1908690 RepID=A0A225E492_9BACT|nr:c-type cytochrome [Fimbriiglobus ruber]OWK43505.1 hypothetical protein FRUB_03104 [Fimbriiglobus ruber]
MPRWSHPLICAALFAPLATLTVLAVPPDAQKDKKAVPQTDAERAAAAVQVEKGLKVNVWAAEPLFTNPVAFSFDEHGKCYVVETHRLHAGVTDTRGHMYWLDDDLACRSVADRLAMYTKHKYGGFEKSGETVRVVWDYAGTGKADKSELFAGPFNKPADGIAAGVLARQGSVYLACIPDLYRLKDTKGTNKADVVESLATGFGVHVQFLGHDLHGLRMGPDGKLYMSIGDRGLNITTKEGRKLFNPDSGCVLRCDPDGANLEIVHRGLRNPQELAFDDYGNLFTYDNNSDSGDRARWVQIVEGGDSGWRCGYQYGTLMHHAGVPQGNRGPWNTEKIWHVPGPDGGPPAYVVPALANFGNGPSGITYYPGVGLSDRYKGHFFACDFTAGAGGSVIWSLAVKPKGASFEVTDLHPFVKNMVPTDCEFGPDGAFYWSDWVGGWDKPNKGRIFRLTDPEAMKNPAVAEAQKLIAEGMEKKTVEELVSLLGHAHREVRQEAQFELTKRGSVPALVKVAKESKNRLARLHAIRGLILVKLSGVPAIHDVLSLANDPDIEVRAQLAKALQNGNYLAQITKNTNLDANNQDFVSALEKLLADPEPRVQFHAALAYGLHREVPYIRVVLPVSEQWFFSPLFGLLKSNNDKDVYLRHAVATALTTAVHSGDELINAWKVSKDQFNTPAVRLGIVLALRKLQSPRLADFLSDVDAKVVAEAARAIYDQELVNAMPPLAELADKSGQSDAVAYRALAANFKLGKPENAVRIANFAARTNEPDYLRETALKLLGDWAKPPRRDPITGLTQSLPERPTAVAADAAKPVLQKLFVGSDLVRKEAVQVTAKLGIKDVGPLMAALVKDEAQPTGVRVEALYALEVLKAKELADAAKVALAAAEPKLRGAARTVGAKTDPTAAAKSLPALLDDEKATAVEKQMALAAMGGLKESKEVDESLAKWLDQLAAGAVSPALALDVTDAARVRTSTKNLKLHAPLKEKLKALDQTTATAAKKDPLAPHWVALAGGDAEKGRHIFLNNAAVYCQRCHKLDGQGGEVGPVLNGIGAKQTTEYLLESVVNPNAKIAEGYQSVILNLVDGKIVSGVLRSKDAKGYTIVTADNKVLTIPKDDVDSEKPDKSAMPDDLHKKLSERELRDVVAFLASLKDQPKK